MNLATHQTAKLVEDYTYFLKDYKKKLTSQQLGPNPYGFIPINDLKDILKAIKHELKNRNIKTEPIPNKIF